MNWDWRSRKLVRLRLVATRKEGETAALAELAQRERKWNQQPSRASLKSYGYTTVEHRGTTC